MGSREVESGQGALDLILGTQLEVLGCDARVLELLGWPGERFPADLRALLESSSSRVPSPDLLIEAALEAVAGGERSSPEGAAEASGLRWAAEPILTAGGGGCRLRFAPSLPLDPSEVWGRAVAHQLRNQLTAVINSHYALKEDAVDPAGHPAAAAHAACVSLASSGIGRSIELLESFNSLVFPEPREGIPTVADCFRWFETLIIPGALRRSATVETDPGRVGSTFVEGQSAGRVLSAVGHSALHCLEDGAILRLAGREGEGHTVLFAVTLEKCEEGAIHRFCELLGQWVSLTRPADATCGIVVDRARSEDA